MKKKGSVRRRGEWDCSGQDATGASASVSIAVVPSIQNAMSTSLTAEPSRTRRLSVNARDRSPRARNLQQQANGGKRGENRETVTD